MVKSTKPIAKLPDWPRRLYPKLAPILAAAYEIFGAADDDALKLALAALQKTAAWPRVISNLRDAKTITALRGRLMHKVMYDLYPPHIMVLLRLACLLDSARGEALLLRALRASSSDPDIHGDLLEIAFDGAVPAVTMDKLVDTLKLQCEPWWATYVGEAIARSPVATKRVAARMREIAPKLTEANKTTLLQLCAAAMLRDAAYRKDVTAISKRAPESIRDGFDTLLKETRSPKKARA